MMRFVGIAANCEIVFIESPHFDAHRQASKALRNGANRQAFIVTLRPIVPGEELRWKYSISQSHRLQPCPPSPFSPLPDDENPPPLSPSAAFPRAAATPALGSLPQRLILGDENHLAKVSRAAATPALGSLPQRLILGDENHLAKVSRAAATWALPQHQIAGHKHARAAPKSALAAKTPKPDGVVGDAPSTSATPDRCEGCTCTTACTSIKYCLTPRNLGKRQSGSAATSSNSGKRSL
jgi:hypothetical protein